MGRGADDRNIAALNTNSLDLLVRDSSVPQKTIHSSAIRVTFTRSTEAIFNPVLEKGIG
jgi:hypothetical protein